MPDALRGPCTNDIPHNSSPLHDHGAWSMSMVPAHDAAMRLGLKGPYSHEFTAVSCNPIRLRAADLLQPTGSAAVDPASSARSSEMGRRRATRWTDGPEPEPARSISDGMRHESACAHAHVCRSRVPVIAAGACACAAADSRGRSSCILLPTTTSWPDLVAGARRPTRLLQRPRSALSHQRPPHCPRSAFSTHASPAPRSAR